MMIETAIWPTLKQPRVLSFSESWQLRCRRPWPSTVPLNEGAGEAQGTAPLQAIVPSEIIDAVTEQWTAFRRSHGKAARAAVAPYCS